MAGQPGSLCQLRESALSWGWWLPASPLEARLFRAFAACLQFQGGKDGGQAGEEGRASVSLLPPGVSDVFGITVSAFVISFLPAESLKYLPQELHVQYSMFPSSVQVAAFAST